MAIINISQAALEQIKDLAEAGDLSAGWKILADHGDAYAHLAAKVVVPELAPEDQGNIVLEFFHAMVDITWENATGSDLAGSPVFVKVGEQHLLQYIGLLEDKPDGVDRFTQRKGVRALFKSLAFSYL